MFKIRIGVLLALVVALFAITAIPALAAKEFVAKNTGQLKDKGTTVQKFSTGGVGTVECSTTTSEGKVTQLKSTQTKEIVNYSGCKAFGFPATVSPAEYNFHINNTTSVTNTITIKVPGAGCEVTVTPTSNENLGKVEYTSLATTPKTVEIKAEVKGITSTIKGSALVCGTSNSTGKYEGNAIAGLEGGGDLSVA
jgi:hypothetical protein